MSVLLLRTECDPVFEEYGLSQLHVAVNNKQLEIVGECGQRICSVKGVVLSNNSRFSAREREVAKDYLRKFIYVNKSIIDEYIVKRSEQKATQDVESPPNFTNTSTTYNRLNIKVLNGLNFSKTLPSGIVRLYYSVQEVSNGEVTLTVTLKNMADFSLVPEFITESVNNAILYTSELNKVEKINEEVTAIKSRLNSCTL